MSFGVIVADPPWSFRDALPGPKRGASKHYSTLTLEEVKRFTLPPLADNAILFLWRVASMQQESLDVARAWGFSPMQELVWCKTQMGMGRLLRNAHETCLIATRKKYSHRRKALNVWSHFTAPRSSHSTKPEAFYELVERLTEGPYVELFARRQRPGWTCLGNELALPAQPHFEEVGT